MKELYPQLYDILSKVPVPAHAAGEASSIYRPSPPSGYPVLGLDPHTNELVQVRWNNDDRSVMNHLRSDLVEKWYVFVRSCNLFPTKAHVQQVRSNPGLGQMPQKPRFRVLGATPARNCCWYVD